MHEPAKKFCVSSRCEKQSGGESVIVKILAYRETAVFYWDLRPNIGNWVCLLTV